MAEREELILEVEVDADRATSDLRGVEREADNVEEAFEDVGTAAERAGRALVEAAESARTEMVQAKAATDALANALGPELAGKADLDSVVADLQRMGLSLEEIRAEADTLATAMKQVDGVRLDGLSQGVDITRTRMGGLRDSADQSRSVLANLAGNASQDLGELGGVAGTAGVAIGQLAEYAVDGNIKLRNLAAVAGPMLGVAAATLLVTKALQDSAKVKAFDTEQVEAFRDSIRELEDGVAAVRNVLEEAGAVEFNVSDWNTVDITPLLAQFGATVNDVAEAVAGGDEGLERFRLKLVAAGASADAVDFIMAAVNANLENFEQASINAEAGAAVFTDNLRTLQAALDATIDPLSIMSEQWKILIRDVADGELNFAHAEERVLALAEATGLSTEQVIERAKQEYDQQLQDEADAAEEAAEAERDAAEAAREHAAAVRETSQALADTVSGFNGLTQRTDAIAAAFGRLNSQSELTATQEVIEFADGLSTLGDAIDDLVDSDVNLDGLDLVPDSWAEVLNMPEELRPVIDALGQFRGTMQSEFTQAFARGGEPAALEWAANTRRAIIDELARAGIEAPEQVDQILSALGLLPPQVDILIEASNAERARAIIEDIGSTIDALPRDVQLRIAAIAQDDPVAALEIAIAAFRDEGIQVPAELVLIASELGVQVDAAVAAAGTPRVAVSADTAPMSEQILEAANDTPTATIEAEADTAAAAEALLDEADRPRIAYIIADALVSIAQRQLNDFVNQDRTATIDARIGSVPSATEFRNRIGTIRVPVQAFWNTRIEGNRPT